MFPLHSSLFDVKIPVKLIKADTAHIFGATMSVDNFSNYYNGYIQWKYLAPLVFARLNQAVDQVNDRSYHPERRGFVNYLLGGPDRQQGGMRLQAVQAESKSFIHLEPLAANRRA